MKLIIAGGRNAAITKDDIAIEVAAIVGEDLPEIVSGHSGNVDMAGEALALYTNCPLSLFHADWDKFGLAAGPIRNKQMAEYADVLLAFWDGKSKGTKNMIDEMRKVEKEVIVIEV